MKRWVLDRFYEEIECDFGTIRIKVARLGDQVVNVWPEYEDLKAAATSRNIPLKIVRAAVMKVVGAKYYYE